ncbi:MAG: GLPGLI family protein [Dysgonamonadaceae bacterium]|jgi:GLPGLI family protein|nr:GLPGLI family protein [Dysgonamonadaceae bacterium]
MKKILLSFILALTPCVLLYSQEKPLDTVKVRFLYRQSSVMDTLNVKKKTVDLMLLDIGSSISKYHALYGAIRDSIAAAMFYQNKTPEEMGAAILKVKKTSFVTDYIIYKNHPKGKLTLVDNFAAENYTYEEPMPVIQWSLKNDTATLLGYLCKKATTTFRGRNYEVWYAPEIPLQEGPWKFCGLPGLILKAKDDQSYFSFVCIAIEFPEGKTIEQRSSRRIVSKTVYNDTKQRYLDNTGKFLTGSPLFNGTLPPHSYVKKPYNPIERTEE